MPLPDHPWYDRSGRLHKAGSVDFAEGNKGGPGRKPLRDELRLIKIVDEELTDEEARQIIRKHIQQAKNGSIRSTQFLWSYAIGTPKPVPGGEQQESPMVAIFQQFLERLPAEQAVRLLINQGYTIIPPRVEEIEESNDDG